MKKPLRKQSLLERQKSLKELFHFQDEEISLLKPLDTLADLFVECSIGSFSLPFGLATNFVINGKKRVIPMVTEEPSVIAAATYAATLIKEFQAITTEPLITTEIYLLNPERKTLLESDGLKIGALIDEEILPNMVKRGGGFRQIELFERSFGLVVSITLNVCESMGANSANKVAEALKTPLEKLFGGEALMGILTNASLKRVTTATFSLPTRVLVHPNYSGEEIAKRILLSQEIANEYENRAVTHNKGIMNGVTALMLATGNDTRAIEASCHHFANKKPLSQFSLEDGYLKGALTLPLSLGVVGGATNSWPHAKLSLKILENPTSKELCEIACALGLAQNTAALLAIVTDGIQKGHMKKHTRRMVHES
jgi:hydroxymethylglutaryl-CoA reductase